MFNVMAGCKSSDSMMDKNPQEFITDQSNLTEATDSDSSYKIKAEDEIELLVWEEPKFNTSTIVSPQGTIAVPLIGKIQASNKTHKQLKEDLRDRLSKYIKGDINMTLTVRKTERKVVSVFGMVVRPDNYSIDEETSIFEVLSKAGGPNERANVRNIRIYRKNQMPHYSTVDLSDYFKQDVTKPVIQLDPGDVVYVPQKNNAVREMSHFLRDVAILFGIFRVLN